MLPKRLWTPRKAKRWASFSRGTAAWDFAAITQYILGVKPDYMGLSINPCIPKDWKGFKVTRKFRDATYHVNISNPNGVSKGIKSITVDGKAVEGNVLPILPAGSEAQVEVVMG